MCDINFLMGCKDILYVNSDADESLQPNGMQKIVFQFLNGCASPKFALLFLCLASIGQGFLTSGLLSVVITTLEKRFHLHSTETGFIASCYDIASCLLVLLITYAGGNGSKPRWIGWGVFIMGVGSIVFSLPHFLAPEYIFGEEKDNPNICNSNFALSGKCSPSHLKSYMFFFIVGQLLHGAGGTTLFTLGVTYLDENVSQVKSSLYHGVYFASSVLGPALGFLLGGRILSMFTDISKVELHFTDDSPLWIGAWWLGFLAGGCAVIVMSFPILLLPKTLPGTAHLRIGREGEMHQNTATSPVNVRSLSGFKFMDIGASILNLLRNPTFITITLAGTLDTGLVLGLTTFGPKYLQSMYSVTPSQAAMYFGVLAILAGVSGQLIGGLIVSRFKLSVKKIIKFCIVCSVFTTLTTFIFFSTCPDSKFAGATVPYSNESSLPLSAYNHTAPCNAQCSCNHDIFEPVCGDDVTYYSACFAGCSNVTADYEIYSNCSCLKSKSSEAHPGKCQSNQCNSLSLFLAVFFFAILGTFLPTTPAIQAILRVVPFSQRSLAVGVKYVILRILGSIPAPIIFGKVLDLACAVWSTECESVGACKLYKNAELASHMALLISSTKILIVVFYVIAWVVYNPPPEGSVDDTDTITLVPTTRDSEREKSGTALRKFVDSSLYNTVRYESLEDHNPDS